MSYETELDSVNFGQPLPAIPELIFIKFVDYNVRAHSSSLPQSNALVTNLKRFGRTILLGILKKVTRAKGSRSFSGNLFFSRRRQRLGGSQPIKHAAVGGVQWNHNLVSGGGTRHNEPIGGNTGGKAIGLHLQAHTGNGP